jgi:hypothetical protein
MLLFLRRHAPLLLFFASVTLLSAGCMSAYRKSVGGDTELVYNRTYLTDINTAWQGVLEAIKASPIDVTNREAGFIQTKWIDNTEQRNFTDSFGGSDYVLRAQYRFRINVSKTFYNGEPGSKISVQKEQLIQYDVLEGWRRKESDSIDEKSLLYRIGRIVYMRMKIAKIEALKVQHAIDQSGLGAPGGDSLPPPEDGASPMTASPAPPPSSGDLPPP